MIRAEGESAEGPQTYPLSFSSEAPVRRYNWMDDSYYDEVLSHEPGDVDLSRAADGLPLIKSHNRMMHFGTVSDVSLDGRQLRGVASFASTPLGQEQETLLREGHARTVSVGYQVRSMELISRNEQGIPTYRCKWMPYEVSIDPIPADPGVGFGRSAEEADLIVVPTSTRGEHTMDPNAPVTPTPPQPTNPPPAPVEVRDRGAEAATIIELANANGMGERAAEWIRSGATPDQVSRQILAAIQTRGPAQPASEALDAMPERDRRRYSYQRAVMMQAELRDGRRSSYDGLEAEVHQELQRRRLPNATDHGGVLVPWSMERTMGTTQPTGGASLVGQTTMPELIDVLRNRALCLVAGARLYPGLTGNVIFNRATADPTIYWMDENPPADVTQSEPAYGYLTMSPKTLIGQVQIPRQLMVQSSVDIENDIRTRLAAGHALKLDLAALHGLGSDKQPIGIWNQTGVLTHAVGGVPDLADLVTMAALVADKNADLGSLGYMTTSLMAGVLKRTAVVTGYPPFLWEGTFREGMIQGFPAWATNQVSKTLGSGGDEHGLIFGNWNDLAIGIWGNELEVVVDVVTLAARAQIKITSYSMCDTGILRTDSFVKGTGAKIA